MSLLAVVFDGQKLKQLFEKFDAENLSPILEQDMRTGRSENKILTQFSPFGDEVRLGVANTSQDFSFT